MLWISVAWDRDFKGDAQVQVTLRDDDGLVLGSRIVRTNVLPKKSRQRIERIRQLLRVRRFSELELPTSTS